MRYSHASSTTKATPSSLAPRTTPAASGETASPSRSPRERSDGYIAQLIVAFGDRIIISYLVVPVHPWAALVNDQRITIGRK
jgi:hypothetical protein